MMAIFEAPDYDKRFGRFFREVCCMDVTDCRPSYFISIHGPDGMCAQEFKLHRNANGCGYYRSAQPYEQLTQSKPVDFFGKRKPK